MSRRVFQEEVSIWTRRLNKEDALTNVGGYHPIHWGPENGKVDKGWICSLCIRWDIRFLLPLDISTLDSWPSDLDWNLYHRLPEFSGPHVWTRTLLPAFLGFQIADGRSWGFSPFLLTRTNPQNKRFSIHLYLTCGYRYTLLVLLLWRALIIQFLFGTLGQESANLCFSSFIRCWVWGSVSSSTNWGAYHLP